MQFRNSASNRVKPKPDSRLSTEIASYATLLKHPQLPSLSLCFFSSRIKESTQSSKSLSSPSPPITTHSNSNTNTSMVVRSRAEAPEVATPSNHTMTISIFSYNGNLMLAATISLLLVILFVLLLHIYAKWFLFRARRRRIRRRQASSLTGFLRGFHHFQTFSSFNAASSSSCPTKGLDPSLIASIPIFLYKRNPDGSRDDDRIRRDLGLECVICLSDFEDDDIGRALEKCGHEFHAECIDMWLHSHTTCPICRSPAAGESFNHEIGAMQQGEWESVIVVGEDNNNSSSRARVEEDEVVMDVFIVSVSVSRGGSARRLTEEDA